MARIIRDGKIIHPDELRDVPGSDPAGLVIVADEMELEQLGITPGGPKSSWYVLADGSKVQGRAKAIAVASAQLQL